MESCSLTTTRLTTIHLKVATRNLNKVIDAVKFYPVEEAKESNFPNRRPLGLGGIQGLADAFRFYFRSL